MINYETILSAYNDKVTLVKWLKKVEEALLNDTLQSIEIEQPTADTAIFTFIFGSGDTLQSPTLNLPQGATGAKGDDGVSVVNAEIDASNHLILTLSNGTQIDCGAILASKLKQSIIYSNQLLPLLMSETPIQNPNQVFYGNAVRHNSLYASTTNGALHAPKFYLPNNEELKNGIFECSYGTTTYAQITQALSDGKMPICTYNNKTYKFTLKEGSFYFFTTIFTNTSYYLRVNTSNTWAIGSTTMQNVNGLVTSISNASTNEQYPTAKATYNFGTNLMKPSANANTTILNHEAVFTFGSNVFNASNNKWLAIFTFGNTFTMIPLYTLSQGVTYKTAGTFVYDGNGSVVSTTINYEITGDNAIVFSSGNSNFEFEEDYMAYLFLLKLY